MPTRSLVTIIMSMMSHHSIQGLHVSHDLGHFLQDHFLQDQFPPVLDSRISYKGAHKDYAESPDFLAYLEAIKSNLHACYIQHYVNFANLTS